MPVEQFNILVADLVRKLEVAFTELKGNNDAGKITITKTSPRELEIKV